MTARTPLIPLDDALTELLAQARPLAGVDTVSTFDADGRVLAQAAISPLQVPQQDNSAMDGYALRCADVAAAGVELRVSQRIAAGVAYALNEASEEGHLYLPTSALLELTAKLLDVVFASPGIEVVPAP